MRRAARIGETPRTHASEAALSASCSRTIQRLAFINFYFYSANHPLESSSLTPIRLLPSISSIHEPFTSAFSLPPNGGTNLTCEPSGISTSIRSVAPPWLILTALAFAIKELPDASVPSTSNANSTGTRGLRGRWVSVITNHRPYYLDL